MIQFKFIIRQLQSKYENIKSAARRKLSQLVRTYIRKFDIYQKEELIALINSKSGLVWGEFLLLGIQSIDERQYCLLYCKPNKWVNLITIDINEFLSGNVTLADTPGGHAIDVALKSYPLIQKIGTFTHSRT